MANPIRHDSVRVQFYHKLDDNLRFEGGDDQYDLIGRFYETIRREDPDFIFPELDTLLQMRKDKNKKFTKEFKFLKETIRDVVKQKLQGK
ncbi:MAG: hypothetical protein WCG42_08950 [Parachlamydiaceae bacterium]